MYSYTIEFIWENSSLVKDNNTILLPTPTAMIASA